MTTKEFENVNNITKKCIDFFDTMAIATTLLVGLAAIILVVVTIVDEKVGLAIGYLFGGAFVCVINYFGWFAGACLFANLYSLNNKDNLEESEPFEPKKWSERNEKADC